ncbi:hypothetical protein DFO63_4091 [Stenotrophomonas sp. AG209]|nr:hypothetical protein DFO63_4091 [Stenotrophomonas sp. AG209]
MLSKAIMRLFHRLQCAGDTSLQPLPELSQLLDSHIWPKGLRLERRMGEAVGDLVGGGYQIHQNFGYLAKHHQFIRRSLPADLFECLSRTRDFLLFVLEFLACERSNCATPASEFAGGDDSGERHLPAASDDCLSAFAIPFCQVSGGSLLGLVDNGAKEGSDSEDCLRPAGRRGPPIEWMAEQVEWRAIDSLSHINVDHGRSLAWARSAA